MINAKDLMIGDWVKFPIGNERIIDLLYIHGRGICASFAASATLFPVEVEKLHPIPLTSEILEKNDFELYGNEWQYHTEDDKGHVLIEFSKDNKLSINIYNSLALKDDKGRADLVHFGRDWCDSFYVHDLQNVFRLCGIEKEIEL